MKVTYDSKVCIHAANCVKTLPTVFKVVDGRFVIDQQGADGLSFWRLQITSLLMQRPTHVPQGYSTLLAAVSPPLTSSSHPHACSDKPGRAFSLRLFESFLL